MFEHNESAQEPSEEEAEDISPLVFRLITVNLLETQVFCEVGEQLPCLLECSEYHAFQHVDR